MLFREPGPKVEILRSELASFLERSSLALEAVPEFVNEESVERLLVEDDIVLLCVDNHATRRLVAQRVSRLGNALLISGGNDGVGPDSHGVLHAGTWGNVQIHVRQAGRDATPSLERFHPEIANPADQLPSPSCLQLSTSTPQILFTNLATASAILNALLLALSGELHYAELAFDIRAGRMRPLDLPGMPGSEGEAPDAGS